MPVQESHPGAAWDPEVVARVAGLGAVFLGGGDPDRLLSVLCWDLTGQRRDTPVLGAVRQVLERGGAVGGTSAGVEVLQREVVILGGLSWNTLARGAMLESQDPDDLTYDPRGGLGLLPGPVIDAHFSEQGRQGRLLGLLRDTVEEERGSSWGLGLDEDTALECRGASCTVLGGPGGVWVVSIDVEVAGDRLLATTSFLTEGDILNTTDLSVTFPEWKQPVEGLGQGPTPTEAIFSPLEYLALAEDLLLSGEVLALGQSQRRHPVILVELTKTGETRAVQGEGRVSYSGLRLTFKKFANIFVELKYWVIQHFSWTST